MKDFSWHNISLLLLAGGKNSRMGQNKALLTFRGKTFLENLIDEFSDFDEILVSCKTENQYDLKKYNKEIKLIPDQNPDKGPLEGIRRALEESKNDFVFVCAADMPLMTKEVPQYIADFFSSDYDAYVPLVDGRAQPLCAVYKKTLLAAVENQLKSDQLKLSLLFDKVPVKYIPMEKSSLNKNIFFNVNTPREYAALQKPYIFCVSGIKNSGKTRMIVALTGEIRKKGYSVAVIKHDGHDCFSDNPESDTFLFEKAGSLATGIYSDRRLMFFANKAAEEDGRENLNDLLNQVKALKQIPDFIILEGLKSSAFPKVEILRRGISEKSLCNPPLICTAGDFYFPDESPLPHFDCNKPEKIFDCIKDYFHIKGDIHEFQ